MAERKRSTGPPAAGDEGSGSGAGADPSPVDDEQQADASPAETGAGRVEVRAGGFVTQAEPVAETPEPIIPCSVCGQTLVDGHCPRGHGSDKSGGWQAAPPLPAPDEDG